MTLNRRAFLAGTAGFLASAPKTMGAGGRPAASPNFAAIRNDFPWIENQTYINNAGVHPVSAPAARVIEQHVAYKLRGPGSDRLFIGEERKWIGVNVQPDRRIFRAGPSEKAQYGHQ